MAISQPQRVKFGLWQGVARLLHVRSKKFVKVKSPSYFALFSVLDLESRFLVFLAILFAIAAGAPLPIIGVIFARIVDVFPPPEDEVITRVKQLVVVASVYLLVTWGWAFCWGVVGARISQCLRLKMVDRALGLDLTYYETECPDITSRLTIDAQTVQTGTAEKVGFFLQSCSYFVVSFIIGLTLNARLTGILIVAILPSLALIFIGSSAMLSRYSTEAAEETTLAASIAAGAIKAVQVVQAFDAFEALANDHKSHLRLAMKIGVKKAVGSAVLLGSIFFVAYAANALAFWEGSRIVSSSVSLGGAGTIYAIVFLILDASFVIGQAGPFVQSFRNAASAGGRIFDLINYRDVDIDVYSKNGIRADKDTFTSPKEIRFEDVTFAYPTRSAEIVLNSVNLRIKTGTTVGIVGASGSGKSTIAGLLLRIYDPINGKVIVDDHSLPEYHLPSLRHQIALVDQDPAVFSGTIYSNIRAGYNGNQLPEERLRIKCVNAAKDADAWSFIDALPEGLDTWLGEPSGTKLSGGQKQRLCLARAFISSASLLVLDEATSALDTISEAAILSNLAISRSLAHQTTLIIAHRLATVKYADSIIVMDKGRVIEQGNHDALMSREDGSYKQLVETQKITYENSLQATTNELELPDNSNIHVKSEVLDVLPEMINPPLPKTLASFAILGRCLALTRSRVGFSCLALLGSLITGGLLLAESFIFGHLVSLINGVVPTGQIDFYCIMFFIVACAALIGYITCGSCFGLVSEHLVMRTRDISLRTVLHQDMEWFLQPGRSTSALNAVISMDSGHISGLSGVIIGTMVSALVSVVGGAILAHIVAWRIAIVLFATAPIVVLAGFFRLRVVAIVEENNQQAYTQAAALAAEACSNIRTIAALSLEAETSRRFHEAVRTSERQTFRYTALGNLLLAIALSITYHVYSLAYWWGAKQVREGRYTAQDFFIVLPAILFSAQAAGQIFSLAPDIGRARGAAARVFALHDQKPSIDKSLEMLQTVQTDELSQTHGSTEKGTIKFENVCLAYKSRPSAPIFTNLNLTIRSGETVALVGRSGAGKTSLISLIERFYDPTSGTIYLDGVNIRSIPVSQHRARISLVSQDPDLFSGSVAFNVGLGAKPGHVATRQEVVDACKAVGIHEFVEGLVDGYETQCGINGSQLSGGQKQRVAIARAYIRDPEILLLDEATSALDSNSEKQIQNAIMNTTQKRTTIIIAHRLTTVQKADRILVFDQGKIVDEGTHGELLRRGGVYERMVRAMGS